MCAVCVCVVCVCWEVEEVMHSVEWDMLLFFAAQFVMVEVSLSKCTCMPACLHHEPPNVSFQRLFSHRHFQTKRALLHPSPAHTYTAHTRIIKIKQAAAEVGLINMIGGWLEAAIRAAPPASRCAHATCTACNLLSCLPRGGGFASCLWPAA